MLAALLAGLMLATSPQLPIDQHFTGLSMSTAGVPWVTEGRGRGHGAYGAVGADGQPVWHPVDGVRQWDGRLVARPDGGMWLLADERTLLRIAPDGTAARLMFPSPN